MPTLRTYLERIATLRAYWRWLCRRPLLFVLAALLIGILCCGLGDTYGVPDLFWHDAPWSQFFAGFGVALLFAKICFVGYLLEDEAAWLGEMLVPLTTWGRRLAEAWNRVAVLLIPRIRNESPTSDWRMLRWYVSVTWLPLALVACLPVLTHPLGNYPFAAGIVAFAAITHAIVRLYQWWDMGTDPERSGDLHRIGRHYFWILFAVYAMLVALPTIGAKMPAALSFCLLLGLVADIYGWIAYHFGNWLIPATLVLLLLSFLANSAPGYKQRYPGLEEYYFPGNAVSLEEFDEKLANDEMNGARSRQLREQDVLTAWRRRHGGQVKPKLVVLATQGGGIRAAVWTGVVLATLEGDAALPGLSSRIRIMTGASGGMLGAAYFAATLRYDGSHCDGDGRPLRREDLYEDLENDGLTPIARQLVLRDLPLTIWPLPYFDDRGRALETAWETHSRQVLSMPFRQLAEGEASGWRPSLILSPMMVEDGRRLLISNLDLRPLCESRGNFLFPRNSPGPEHVTETANATDAPSRKVKYDRHSEDQDRYALSAVEFFRLFPDVPIFKLSTAVRMNASFPYISPATPLPTTQRRRVVDAGFYDNYGVNLAAQWLHLHRQWLRENTSGVVLIQVRDYLTERNRREFVVHEDNEKGREDAWQWSRGLEGLTGPLAGVMSAREAVMSARNDEQVQILHDQFNRGTGTQFFTTVVFECPTRVALNWYLTERAKDEIEAGFQPENPRAGNNVESLKRLREWWAK